MKRASRFLLAALLALSASSLAHAGPYLGLRGGFIVPVPLPSLGVQVGVPIDDHFAVRASLESYFIAVNLVEAHALYRWDSGVYAGGGLGLAYVSPAFTGGTGGAAALVSGVVGYQAASGFFVEVLPTLPLSSFTPLFRLDLGFNFAI